jgi:uncharacterized membrane protein
MPFVGWLMAGLLFLLNDKQKTFVFSAVTSEIFYFITRLS